VTIHEIEDESLLVTLYPRRFRSCSWDVYDAEERPLGVVRKKVVLSRFGQILASLETMAGNRCFRSPQGTEFGWLVSEKGGDQLTFAQEVADEPFVKMLLLASALTVTDARMARGG
jgi:hypothetical protein